MNTMNVIILVAVLILLGVLCVTLFMILNFFKQIREENKSIQEQIPLLVKQQFDAEQSKVVTELETRKQAVEGSVKNLKDQLEQFQGLVREFEKDRDQKYGNLETELKKASEATFNLQESTNQLNNMLGNTKLRGQWGERMVEDIIKFVGLEEGVNYFKQKKLGSTTTIPDYTFLLPDNHIINMDAKFPLDNYNKMINNEDDHSKDRYQKEFERNVKDRIKEVQTRGYINPADNTLDFVILFIPNEQVYGFIHERMPEVMDNALREKVVLCSPFTLYAMLSVIRKSFENFRFEKDMQKIIKLIDQFATLYGRFKDRFEAIGTTIDKLDTTYNDVKNKSFKQLDTKIRHIDDYKKGKGIALESADEIYLDANIEDPIDDKTLLR